MSKQKNNKRIALLCLLGLVILSLAIFFLWQDDGSSTKDQPQAVKGKDASAAHAQGDTWRDGKKTVQLGSYKSFFEAEEDLLPDPPEPELPEEPNSRFLTIDVIPMVDGQPFPELAHEIGEVVINRKGRGIGALLGEKKSGLELHWKGGTRFQSYGSYSAMPEAATSISVRVGSHTMTKSFQATPAKSDKAYSYGTFHFDYEGMIAEDEALITGVITPMPGVDFSLIDNGWIDLIPSSSTFDVTKYREDIGGSIGKDGRFWARISRRSWDHSTLPALSDSDIQGLTLTLEHTKTKLFFNKRLGKAFDFGVAAFQGGLFDFTLTLRTAPVVAWEDAPDAGSAGYLLRAYEYGFSLSSNDGESSSRSRYLGNGVFRAQMIVSEKKQDVFFHAELNPFDNPQPFWDLSKIKFDPIEIRTGATKKIERTFEATPRSLVKFGRTRASFFDPFGDPEYFRLAYVQRSGLAKARIAVAEAESDSALSKALNFSRSSLGPFFFAPSEDLAAIVIMNQNRRAQLIEVTSAPAIYQPDLSEEWPKLEQEDAEEKTLTVILKMNGKRFFPGTKLLVEVDAGDVRIGNRRFMSYSRDLIIELKDEEANQSRKLELAPNVGGVSLRLLDSDGSAGFPLRDLAEPVIIDLHASENSVTLELNEDALFEVQKDTNFHVSATCGGREISYRPLGIGADGSSFAPSSISTFFSGHFPEGTEIIRHAADRVEVRLPTTARVEISQSALAGRPPLTLQSSESSIAINKGGTYAIYDEDGYRGVYFEVVGEVEGVNVTLWSHSFDPKKGDPPPMLKIEALDTPVVANGDAMGLELSLARFENGEEVEAFEILPRAIEAVPAGDFRWKVQKSITDHIYLGHLSVGGVTLNRLQIPDLSEYAAVGEVHIELEGGFPEEVLESRITLMTIDPKALERTRGTWTQLHEPYIKFTELKGIEQTLKDGVLILKGFPINSTLTLRLRVSLPSERIRMPGGGWSQSLHYHYTPVSTIKVGAAGEVAREKLGALFYPETVISTPYPNKDQRHLRSGGRNFMQFEFSIDGKVIPFVEGMRRGVTHSVRIWRLEDGKVMGEAVTLEYTPNDNKSKWEDGALEKLQPMLEEIERANRK